jgi:hypothetical protein
MSYADTTELARILKIRTANAEQLVALQRVLDTATREIDAEMDRAEDADALTTEEEALVEQVCLDRAADLWHHTESATGLTGLLGDDGGIATPGRYSWKRYADRLAPLKDRWGIA